MDGQEGEGFRRMVEHVVKSICGNESATDHVSHIKAPSDDSNAVLTCIARWFLHS